jgi:hypothetical protein
MMGTRCVVGGICVVLEVGDATRALQLIRRHCIALQIPTKLMPTERARRAKQCVEEVGAE